VHVMQSPGPPPPKHPHTHTPAPFLLTVCPPHQVCNHPELFEGQVERWPLQFAPLTTELADALKASAPVVHAGPGRPPKIPASSTWVQVTGFRSHIQVGFCHPWALKDVSVGLGFWSKHMELCGSDTHLLIFFVKPRCWFGRLCGPGTASTSGHPA
jgi:hypothetical protein